MRSSFMPAAVAIAVADTLAACSFDGSSDYSSGGWLVVATFILPKVGQFWIPKNAADVCGASTDGTHASDAEIAASWCKG